MDFFSVAILVFAAVVLGGALVVGLAALVRVRSARREDLQMKQHVGRLAVASSDAGIGRPASHGTRLTG